MDLASTQLNLARSLPPRLLKFFAVNPPRAISAISHSSAASGSTSPESTPALKSSFNPFLPHKNPKTGKWHPPIYSLRRQAELVKLAKKHDVEDLLPYSKKLTVVKESKREEHGLRVKGTGIGQKVKGHEWERTLKGRLEKRRQAMLDMPRLVQTWKEVSLVSARLLMVLLTNF